MYIESIAQISAALRASHRCLARRGATGHEPIYRGSGVVRHMTITSVRGCILSQRMMNCFAAVVAVVAVACCAASCWDTTTLDNIYGRYVDIRRIPSCSGRVAARVAQVTQPGGSLLLPRDVRKVPMVRMAVGLKPTNKDLDTRGWSLSLPYVKFNYTDVCVIVTSQRHNHLQVYPGHHPSKTGSICFWPIAWLVGCIFDSIPGCTRFLLQTYRVYPFLVIAL